MPEQTTLPVELLPPGTGPHDPRWHELRRAGVTASEIAAVMGLSPWESPFSLYWRKVNAWDTADNTYMSDGRHLEDAIANWWWWSDRGEGYEDCVRAGLYAHPERPWQLATPDRLILSRSGIGTLLEVKWVAAPSWDGWGEEGTDDIPVYYRAQGLWQADVLGVDTVHFAVLGPGGFRAYVVRRDDVGEADLRMMRGAALDLLRRIAEKEPPDLDSHTATADALRRLHPDLGQGDLEVSLEFAERYRQARLDRDNAKTRVAQCEAEIRALLGSEYARLVHNKRLVASRSIFERKSDDEHELLALDDGFPTTDRLNPGQKLETPYG